MAVEVESTPVGIADVPDAHEARQRPAAWWRGVLAGPVIAGITLVIALVVTAAADVPLRDPKSVTLTRLVIAIAVLLLFAAADVVVRAWRASGRRPARAALGIALRERWTPARATAVGIALLSFFVTYLAYRNLKSVVPLLLPDAAFDGALTDLDRWLFLGSDPAALLHDALGQGIAAHVLSSVYMAFFVFIPVTLAAAFVFARDVRVGLFYAAALSANWLLAAGSYFLLPSLGPFHADPDLFSALPTTAVTDLQVLLVDERTAFLRDPAIAGSAQSIGAFASLHTSIVVTAAIAAHLLGLPRVVRWAAWMMVLLTVLATIYFGWHYVADDVFGVLIAVAALLLARALTGFDPRRAPA